MDSGVIVGESTLVTVRLREPYHSDHKLSLFFDPETDGFLLWVENGRRKLTRDFPFRTQATELLGVLGQLVACPQVLSEAESFVRRHAGGRV